MSGRAIVRWLILGILLLALILVPFALFGEWIEFQAGAFIKNSESGPMVAVVLGGLLATDIFLPVPSSIVSTACGALLGFPGGLLVSWVGMTISCVVGYAVGLRAGGPLGCALVGEKELERLEFLQPRLGAWMVVVTRPVPVLAEAAVLLAGMGRMPFSRFLFMSVLSNLGVSVAYAAVGAWSARVDSFLLAFTGALVFPGAVMLAGKKFLWKEKGIERCKDY